MCKKKPGTISSCTLAFASSYPSSPNNHPATIKGTVNPIISSIKTITQAIKVVTQVPTTSSVGITLKVITPDQPLISIIINNHLIIKQALITKEDQEIIRVVQATTCLIIRILRIIHKILNV